MKGSRSTHAGTNLPPNIAALAQLGAELERRWAARGYRAQIFPALAAEALHAAAYHCQFAEDEVIAWVHAARSLPTQLDPRSRFGQPPLTVWYSDRFVLDLYFWVDTETSIHDHSFAGAFTNLSGHSLNCAYRFEQPTEVGKGLLTGSLQLAEAVYLQPGDVCPIVAGPRFIHRVWHLDCPTVTLVARTIQRPRPRRQYSYFPAGIAIEYRQRPPIEFQRRRELLNYLFRRRHPHRYARAAELMAGAEQWAMCIYLGDVVMHHKQENAAAGELDGLLARLPAHCRTWLDAALAAMRADDPLTSINWARLRRTEHRLLVALLNTFTEREPLLAWLARHGHAGDWRTQLTTWLAEMDADKALRLHLGSARTEIIAHLLRARSDAAVLRALDKTYAITAAEAELLKQGFKRFRQLPFLQPLLQPHSAGVAGNSAQQASL